MQGQFEQHIQTQLEQFSLEPSKEVWADIEAALPEKKKRKFAFLWMAAAACFGFLIMGSIYFIYPTIGLNHTTSIHDTNKINYGTKPTLNASVFSRFLNTTISTNPASLTDNFIKSDCEGDLLAVTNLNTSNPSNPSNTLRNLKVSTNKKHGKVVGVRFENNSSSDFASLIRNSGNSNGFENEYTRLSHDNKQLTNQNLSLVLGDMNQRLENALVEIDAKDLDSIRSTYLSNQFVEKKSSSVGGRQQWLLVAGGGSLMENSSLFSLKRSPNVYSQESRMSSSNSFLPYNTTVDRPHSGFQFFVGGKYAYTINKRFSTTVGLQYRYMQNSQGLTENPSSSESTTYVSGNSVHQTNYQHWIEMPISVDYQLFGNRKNTVSLDLGVSVAYKVASKWLVLDKAMGALYYDPSFDNHIFFNTSTGLVWNHNQQYRIGIEVQQSLTPIYKNISNPDYFSQYSIVFGVPISSLFSKKHLH